LEYGFQQPEHASFPPIVHVETTNACNLRCIHCPHHDVKSVIPDYRASFMDLGLWKRVAEEVAAHPAALRLTPDGEPMLHPDWIEQVRHVQAVGVKTLTFNTHGMFLEGPRAEVLLQASKTDTVVEVSLDGFFKDTYEKIRVRGDYDRILKNIFTFADARKGKKNVKLMVSVVAQPEIAHEEIELFDRFWSKVVDKVIIRNYVDTKGLTPRKNIDERVVDERWPCPVVFTRMVVTWDGRVRFCPDDWMKDTTLATLEEAGSLAAIWTSERFRALRESHLAGRFEHPTCAGCTDWKTIRWGKDYTAALRDVQRDQKQTSNLVFLWNRARDGAATG